MLGYTCLQKSGGATENKEISELIKSDAYRYCARTDGLTILKLRHKDVSFRQLYYFRRSKVNAPILKQFYRLKYHFTIKKSGVVLPPSVELGEGALFIHPTAIVINSKAKIGKNLTMLKGSTIGNCKRGLLKGTPQIGDDVYIGLNATIVGNVVIGNDVMVCANSFVNFDVPDHSVVVGNPGVIHHRDCATEGYIENRV